MATKATVKARKNKLSGGYNLIAPNGAEIYCPIAENATMAKLIYNHSVAHQQKMASAINRRDEFLAAKSRLDPRSIIPSSMNTVEFAKKAFVVLCCQSVHMLIKDGDQTEQEIIEACQYVNKILKGKITPDQWSPLALIDLHHTQELVRYQVALGI